MEKPKQTPKEWIDKLFTCMTEFYGERWTKQFDRFMPEDLLKTVWQSALYGCTYEEIRNVLVHLKQAAKSPASKPPHHLEFHRYTKGARPHIERQEDRPRGNPEVARRALDEINAKLRYKDATG